MPEKNIHRGIEGTSKSRFLVKESPELVEPDQERALKIIPESLAEISQ